MMLAIEIEFLTGRFVATSYHSRVEPEWPPHPARLYSAMAAAHFAAEGADPAERAALDWLARLEPPCIHATEAAAREVTTVFVPVNDVAITGLDEDALALDEAEAQLRAVPPSDARRFKTAAAARDKATRRLAAAVARATSVPSRAGNPKAGLALLPEFRPRQPRTFPSVTPEQPRVAFTWPDAEVSQEHRAALDTLLQRVVRMGHSSSLVSARVAPDSPGATWWPSAEGEVILRVPRPDQLVALEAAFASHLETESGRVMPARFQAYTRRAPTAEHAPAPSSIFSDNWLVLRRVGGPQVPMTGGPGMARTLRRALMSRAAEPISEVLSGHASAGGPSPNPHLAVVPLPFVGHAHASGAILGVALVLPREVSGDDRKAVYGALRAWETVSRIEDEDPPAIGLALGAVGVLDLLRVESGGVAATLRPDTWCQAAQTWASVTPVALDQNPGDLRSRDAAKAAAAIAAAEMSLRRSCSHAGLPEPVRVEVLPAAPWAGAAKAQLYPPFPEAEGRLRRVLTHARIEFADPVGGPVLIGAGRFHGLGLFRPVVVP